MLEAKTVSNMQTKFFLHPECDVETFLGIFFYMARDCRSISFNFTGPQWDRLPADFKAMLVKGN